MICTFFIKTVDKGQKMWYHNPMEKKYYKHKLENLLVVNKVVTIHYFEFDKSFVSHTESHDFWELVYAEKGNLICSTEGEEILLQEGEVIFYKPGVSHAHRADGKHAPNVFIISFECKNQDKQECFFILYKIQSI